MAFFLMISVLWAVLPLLIRTEVEGGPELYGILLGCMGVGAVASGLTLPGVRMRVSPDWILAVGSLGAITALLGLAFLRQPVLLGAVMVLSGASWIAVLSTLQVSAQLALPSWVRARGLAVFLASFMGTVAVGSAVWGRLAALTNISTALVAAALTGLVGLAITSFLRLDRYANADRTLAEPVPEPSVVMPIEDDRGPVMVTVEYQVDPGREAEFDRVMRDLRRMRLRNGAVTWGLFQDAANESRFVEVFLDESWVAHLRHHHRLTLEDREIKERADALHISDTAPASTHLVARNLPKRRWRERPRR